MSRPGVIVALIVAVLLAAAAVVVMMRPQGGSAPTGPLLDFEPAALMEIRVSRPGAGGEIARRLPSGSWVIQLGDSPPWPAAGERIRPAIRILSTLESVRPAETGGRLGADAAEVRLQLAGGGARVMRMAPRPLAGAVWVEIGEGKEVRRAWVDAALSDMLVSTGLREWRQRRALGELGPDVARVHIQGTHNSIELGRVQGRWALRQPVAQPAEPDAIARLFSLLAQVEVEDFLDAGPPANTGLKSPIAALTLESDQRNPADPTRVTTSARKLEVGQTADVAGRTVFARLSGTETATGESGAEWSRTVVLTGQPLAEIATDAAAYISRRALAIPAAEIGRIEFSPDIMPDVAAAVAFARTLEGWRRAQPDGSEGPLAPADPAGIRTLLELLTVVPAEAVSLAVPEGVQWIARIDLASLGGSPLGRVEIASGPGGRAIVSDGTVWRTYPAAASGAVLEWLSGL